MSINLGNRVTTTTQDKILPKVVDTVLDSNVFATRMLKKAEKFSGEKIKVPVKHSKNTTGQSFSGFDTFSTEATDNRVNMEFAPSFYQMTVSLPLTELAVNATEEKVIDLAKLEMASTAQDMADDIGTLFYGDGTGNGGKDFLGLGAIVDDGTSVATYGGLSRSTYTTLRATKTASAGSITLAKLRTLYNAVASGSQKPTVGLTTETVFALYESLLQAQERYGGSASEVKRGIVSGTGAIELYFRGTQILADEKCTSGNFYFLNEDFLTWKALPMPMAEAVKFKSQDIEGNDYSDVMGLGFSWGGWIKPTNAAAIVGHIYLGGELICSNPKRQGVLTGITTAA